MKKLVVLLCAIVLVCGLAAPAGAAVITLGGLTNSNTALSGANATAVISGWSDVDQGAGNFCWLASASNMLAYAGWVGGASLTSATDIFSYSTPYWANVNGNPYWDVQWWFDGVEGGPSIGGLPGGGNFYSEALFNSSFAFAEASAGIAPSTLKGYITGNVTNGRVFSLLSGDSTAGIHFVTGWGYETDASGGVAGVYYTDSFNVGGGLEYSLLSCGTANCSLFSGQYIRSSSSLAYNSGNIPPNVTTPDPDPDPNPVPEPSTLLLFGSGLIAVISRRRKK